MLSVVTAHSSGHTVASSCELCLFDEEFLETKEQLQKLQDGNHLLFQQVPMVEIDGMKLVQTRSILHYIADKHHLFGKDLKERTLIDMYVEGTLDLLELIIMHPFLKPDDQQKEVVNMAQKAIIRYFPVFEKVPPCAGYRREEATYFIHSFIILPDSLV
ncbi:Glutathione S-transferase A4, partial [Eschrichtius robustus]|nr:Glutathione S-transferase A4 [Eschrichtius robustus]